MLVTIKHRHTHNQFIMNMMSKCPERVVSQVCGCVSIRKLSIFVYQLIRSKTRTLLAVNTYVCLMPNVESLVIISLTSEGLNSKKFRFLGRLWNFWFAKIDHWLIVCPWSWWCQDWWRWALSPVHTVTAMAAMGWWWASLINAALVIW